MPSCDSLKKMIFLCISFVRLVLHIETTTLWRETKKKNQSCTLRQFSLSKVWIIGKSFNNHYSWKGQLLNILGDGLNKEYTIRLIEQYGESLHLKYFSTTIYELCDFRFYFHNSNDFFFSQILQPVYNKLSTNFFILVFNNY